jgi:hypothetical protein
MARDDESAAVGPWAHGIALSEITEVVAARADLYQHARVKTHRAAARPPEQRKAPW